MRAPTPDRFPSACVNNLMHRLATGVFTAGLLAAVACGGGSSSKSTKAKTTPEKPQTAGDNSMGGDDTVGDAMSGDNPGMPEADPPGGLDDTGGAAPQDVEPVVAAPAPKPVAPAPEPVKPPGNDLPKEKRDAIVAERLRKAAQEIRGRDTDGAIKDARAALDVDETNVEAMILLAHAYYLKEYDDKALEVLGIAQSHEAGKTHATGWMLMGLLHDRGNREEKALAAYEQATQIKPDYVPALNNQGAIYLKRKRYKDAVEVFERMIAVQHNNPRGHAHLGAAYRGRSAEVGLSNGEERDQFLRRAEMEFKTASAQDPNYAAADFNMGILYLDADPFPGMETLKRLDQAKRYLNEYKRKAGLKAVPAVEDYLAAAQKAYDREQRAIEKKKKQQEKERNKPKEAPPAEPPPAAPAPASEGDLQ